VLTGAVVHAAWNLLLAGAKDSEAAGAVALASGAVIFTPVALATWDIGAAAWPYIVVSAVLELAYFVLLGRAYARAELSLVYPIARGSAPVLVLLASAVLGAVIIPSRGHYRADSMVLVFAALGVVVWLLVDLLRPRSPGDALSSRLKTVELPKGATLVSDAESLVVNVHVPQKVDLGEEAEAAEAAEGEEAEGEEAAEEAAAESAE